MQRVSIDAGFTCPNRDGVVGTGGCVYCGGSGSGAPGIRRRAGVREQVEHGMEVMAKKYGVDTFLAYFQPFSNTYAPVERLRELYDEALAVPGVAGLIVGTRPDCLPPPVVDLLEEMARRTYFWLELGLQTPHERTLALINRGHGFEPFRRAADECRERGIPLCAHLILGLPGESRDEMLETAAIVNTLGVKGVKLHHLHVLEGTELAKWYREGRATVMERGEYVELVCDFLERLDPEVVIHRLVGDGDRSLLLAPQWSLSREKSRVIVEVEAELERRGTRQGSKAGKD